MSEEKIKINKLDGSITFINNGISFSQFGIAKEILDLITNLQQKVEQLENENEYLKYLVDDSHTMKAFIVEHNKVEQLEKENKILKENAEHNDKVVDKVNWENMLLKGKLKDLKERIILKQLRLVNEETYNILHSDLNELLEVLDREIKYEQ